METPRPPAPRFDDLAIEDIDALLDDLEPEETEVSARRRRAHDRIDALRADLVAGTSAQSYAMLARLEVWERRLSAERKALHACIDGLYETRARLGAPARRRPVRRRPDERMPTLLDPDGGRSGTLGHAPTLEKPLGDDRTIGIGPRRLEPLEPRLERPEPRPQRLDHR